MTGPFKKHVNIKKTMGPRGSLHKALGIPANKKIGAAKLKQIAASGNGPNARKAALSLTLNKEWGRKKKGG